MGDEGKKKTSMTLYEDTFEAIDHVIENNDEFRHRNDVIEQALEEFFARGKIEDTDWIREKLCDDSVYILGMDKQDEVIRYVVPEDGGLMKKELIL